MSCEPHETHLEINEDATGRFSGGDSTDQCRVHLQSTRVCFRPAHGTRLS
jgi:hypothetical protein